MLRQCWRIFARSFTQRSDAKNILQDVFLRAMKHETPLRLNEDEQLIFLWRLASCLSLRRRDHPEVIEGTLVEAAGAGVDVGAVVGVVPDHDGGHAAGDDAVAAV